MVVRWKPAHLTHKNRQQGAPVHRIGLYPGTFDPPTNGHIDIFGRAMKLVDTLVIGVAINEAKKPLFSLEERVNMVKAECARFNGPGLAEVKVMPMHGLLMKFAEACSAQMILRGLRPFRTSNTNSR
jgi:pantetheine-phosphate adenylyltransferase